MIINQWWPDDGTLKAENARLRAALAQARSIARWLLLRDQTWVTCPSCLKRTSYHALDHCPSCKAPAPWTDYFLLIPHTPRPATASPEIRDIVRDVLERELGVEREKMLDESRLESDLGADSLDVVMVMMELERAFGISIDDDALAKLRTVGDVQALLASLVPSSE